jgi:hypothetical protein
VKVGAWIRVRARVRISEPSSAPTAATGTMVALKRA